MGKSACPGDASEGGGSDFAYAHMQKQGGVIIREKRQLFDTAQ
jgi:hypothetical protein